MIGCDSGEKQWWQRKAGLRESHRGERNGELKKASGEWEDDRFEDEGRGMDLKK